MSSGFRASLLACALLASGCSDSELAAPSLSAASSGSSIQRVCPLSPDNPHVVAVEGALLTHIALWSDGHIECWGYDDFNLCARGEEYKPFPYGSVEAEGVGCLKRVQFEDANVTGIEAWAPPRFEEGSVLLWGAVPDVFVPVDAFGVGPIELFEEPTLIAPDGPLLVYGPNMGLLWKGRIVLDDNLPPTVIRADAFTAVPLPGPVVDLSADGAPCVVLVDGRLFCWGYGPRGELGLGDISVSTEPALVSSPEPICEVDQGVDWMCGRACSGAVYCTGVNTFEQILPGGPQEIRTLTRIEGLPPLDAIWLEGWTGCGLSVGEVWCWGERYLLSGGESGDPPTRMADFYDVVDVSLADTTSLCVLRKDASVWCDGDYGRANCNSNAKGWQPIDFNCGAQ